MKYHVILSALAMSTLAVSPVASQSSSYWFSSVSVPCGQTLVPGNDLYITWAVVGDPGNDTCFVSIRPQADLFDNTAYVAQPDTHPQCSESAVNILIPNTPVNSSFPFDGSQFLVRINAPPGVSVHIDSCPFPIAQTVPPNWDRIISVVGLAVAIAAAIAAIISAIAACRANAH